ncbi:hypothetical protein [Nocardia sp. NPDC004604]|uniref:hypothetical protein n=1 Tax=Nocardia sp. NPDC004604 TaxID=3157013 RepID=UPI0033A0B7BC
MTAGFASVVVAVVVVLRLVWLLTTLRRWLWRDEALVDRVTRRLDLGRALDVYLAPTPADRSANPSVSRIAGSAGFKRRAGCGVWFSNYRA